jgi:hypothetical protein
VRFLSLEVYTCVLESHVLNLSIAESMGELILLPLEQRFQRTWVWHVAHCEPAKPKEEFDSLVEWTIETHRETRDALHKKIGEERKNKFDTRLNSVSEYFFLMAAPDPVPSASASGKKSDQSSKRWFSEFYF